MLEPELGRVGDNSDAPILRTNVVGVSEDE